MPGWLKDGGLRDAEVQAVVAYVRVLGRKDGKLIVGRPERPPQAMGLPHNGKRIFERTCAGCHGADGKGGEGPALNNKVLLESATDAYLVETIRRGRRGTAMASFLEPSPIRPALAESDINDVVAYLRSLQGGK
jgi:mono/diheme cytochrome c family protein